MLKRNLIIGIMLLSFAYVHAQEEDTIKAYYQTHISHTGNKIGSSDYEVNVETDVFLKDTSIRKLNVRVFSSTSGTTSFTYVFDCNGNNELPQGVFFSREGMKCTLKIGTMALIDSTIEIRFEDRNGNLSNPLYELYYD